MARIVVIGSYNRDLVWYVRGFPVGGQTVEGRFSSAHGGKGSNQAIACAKAAGGAGGAKRVTFVAAVGDDAFGDEAVGFYGGLGADARIARVAGVPTGNAGIFVAESGENVIVISEGANGALRPALVPGLRETLEDPGTGLVIMQCELPFSNTLEFVALISEAKGRNPALRFVFNPAPYRGDFDYARILPHVDIFCPNETEAAGIAGIPATADVDVACCLAVVDKLAGAVKSAGSGQGPAFVVFTLGSRGCRVVDVATREHRDVSSHRAGPVVDTTGAGDCFLGCLAVRLSELLAGGREKAPSALTLERLVAAADFASVAAGISVTRPGAAPSSPAREEVEAALAARAQ